ncbi:hypothetical protein QE454_002713 [Microbacterium sp. SORGH_AS454]|nr:hypothetical protein [Microbacterium sp. SORGH_AS_0454]
MTKNAAVITATPIQARDPRAAAGMRASAGAAAAITAPVASSPARVTVEK